MMKSFLLAAWIFSACLILSLCEDRQYHFVNNMLNWVDAQNYCRKKYTDLATIGNSKDMKQFLETVSFAGYTSDIWIGLNSEINWKWSDGHNNSISGYRNWETSDEDPDFISANQYCVCIGDNGRWWDYDCAKEFPFICYKATPGGTEFVVVDEPRSWSDARTYCQQNFTHLAKMRNSTENQQVQTLVPSGYWAWTGLYRDKNIYWSDQSSFGFSNWDHVSNLIGSNNNICGATSVARMAKWKFLSCQRSLPFVCYSFKGIKRIVKLNIKSNITLNTSDPHLKAKLLRKLQEKLKESAPLKFVERPDGKFLHKKKDKKKTEL